MPAANGECDSPAAMPSQEASATRYFCRSDRCCSVMMRSKPSLALSSLGLTSSAARQSSSAWAFWPMASYACARRVKAEAPLRGIDFEKLKLTSLAWNRGAQARLRAPPVPLDCPGTLVVLDSPSEQRVQIDHGRRSSPAPREVTNGQRESLRELPGAIGRSI
jgi:hypothetical protein